MRSARSRRHASDREIAPPGADQESGSFLCIAGKGTGLGDVACTGYHDRAETGAG